MLGKPPAGARGIRGAPVAQAAAANAATTPSTAAETELEGVCMPVRWSVITSKTLMEMGNQTLSAGLQGHSRLSDSKSQMIPVR